MSKTYYYRETKGTAEENEKAAHDKASIRVAKIVPQGASVAHWKVGDLMDEGDSKFCIGQISVELHTTTSPFKYKIVFYDTDGIERGSINTETK